MTDKQREEGMRWLILGAILSAVAAPALAAEFMLSSTEVKSGSPMALAQVFTECTRELRVAAPMLKRRWYELRVIAEAGRVRVGPLVSVPLIDISPTIACRIAS